MNTATEAPVHVAFIHLGDEEWGSELMLEVAKEYFAAHPDVDLVVKVHEHGGWWLQYVRCGTVVGTANDSAVFGGRAAEIRASLANRTVKYLESIRRP